MPNAVWRTYGARWRFTIMPSQLDEQIRAVVDLGAPTITLEEVEAIRDASKASDLLRPRRAGRSRASSVLVAAVLVLVLLGVAALLLVQSGESPSVQSPATGPTGTESTECADPSGAASVEVPNVVGMALRPAIAIVEAVGLHVIGDGTPPGDPTGDSAIVTAQEPDGLVPAGSCIGFRTEIGTPDTERQAVLRALDQDRVTVVDSTGAIRGTVMKSDLYDEHGGARASVILAKVRDPGGKVVGYYGNITGFLERSTVEVPGFDLLTYAREHDLLPWPGYPDSPPPPPTAQTP
jgi:hypothetical protein